MAQGVQREHNGSRGHKGPQGATRGTKGAWGLVPCAFGSLGCIQNTQRLASTFRGIRTPFKDQLLELSYCFMF